MTTNSMTLMTLTRRAAVCGVAALLAGVSASEAATQPRRSRLRRDAEAITAVGVTGVQARETGPDGRSRVAVSGVADIDTGRPVSPHGFFRIGSTNKTLVATVVLHLAGEGRVSLEDTVEERLPRVVQGNGHDGSRITVRQLLQHTSGIYEGNYPIRGLSAAQYYETRYDVYTPEEIVAAAMRHAPEFAPGEGWSYSNTGYVVLGMLIERVTGQAWHKEVHDRILRPLGMRHTIWPGTSPTLPPPHARGYNRFEPGGELIDTTEVIDADASGGYLSTTADLDRFVRALFDGTLLDAPLLAEMTRTVPIDEELSPWPGARYGLGIFSRSLPCGSTVWIPGGDQVGYKTRTGVTEDGRRSVVVSMSTQLGDSTASVMRQENAAARLIDNALCADR
jgi:D-alanyl-D-alanine carboxypeptidase